MTCRDLAVIILVNALSALLPLSGFASLQVFRLGQFTVHYGTQSDGTPSLKILHSDRDGSEFSVWETIPSAGFVEAAQASALVSMSRGAFHLDDKILRHYEPSKGLKVWLKESSENSEVLATSELGENPEPRRSSSSILYLEGRLQAGLANRDRVEEKEQRASDCDETRRFGSPQPDDFLDYRISFQALSDAELSFELELRESVVDGKSHRVDFESGDYRVFLQFQSRPDEHFFGFGTQYSCFDLKGKEVPIIVREKGIGRGIPFLTSLVNAESPYSGGDATTSCAPVPYYITNQRHSVFLENSEASVFDLKSPDRVRIKVFGHKMKGRILYGNNLLDLVTTYTGYSGRMRPLPEWVGQGAILAVQGGESAIDQALAQIQTAKIPVSAFWIQDWVGSYKTVVGTFLNWDWKLDRHLYPEWEQMVRMLKDQGFRVLTYVNPFLQEDHPGYPSGRSDASLYQQAVEGNYLVKKLDGSPYLLKYLKHRVGLVDLTQPAARSWMKEVLRNRLLQSGVSGWMGDFGEAFPMDAQVTPSVDFQTAREYHNLYPVDWARLQKEVLEEQGVIGDSLFWSRSGFSKSPGEARLFWLGDQLTSWDQYDGMKTALVGLLSSGLSGVSLNHSDIGGYTAVVVPGTHWGWYRTPELFQRWTEMNAFTAVFRTHQGNKPEVNHQFYSDSKTLRHFARFANIFKALAPYRQGLMNQAWEKGTPLVRPLILHYPDDPVAYSIDHEFLLGADFLVAPVFEAGARRVNVYFPAGEHWVGLFSGEQVETEHQGVWKLITAPVGSPAVFYKRDSSAGPELVRRLAEEGIVQ